MQVLQSPKSPFKSSITDKVVVKCMEVKLQIHLEGAFRYFPLPELL